MGINSIVSLAATYVGCRLFGVIGMILFPMLAQILLALNKEGYIRLFREKKEPSGTGGKRKRNFA